MPLTGLRGLAKIWGRRSRKIGGLPPAPPLCRVLTPLQPPNGVVGGCCKVSYLKGTSGEVGTLIVYRGYGWREAEIVNAIAHVVHLKNLAF